jgi:TPR repeat protein
VDDPGEKLKWLKAAAEDGYIPAMYEYGLTVDDPGERRKWLTKAAEFGYEPAKDAIGRDT